MGPLLADTLDWNMLEMVFVLLFNRKLLKILSKLLETVMEVPMSSGVRVQCLVLWETNVTLHGKFSDNWINLIIALSQFISAHL